MNIQETANGEYVSDTVRSYKSISLMHTSAALLNTPKCIYTHAHTVCTLTHTHPGTHTCTCNPIV